MIFAPQPIRPHAQQWQAYMASRQYAGIFIAAIGDSFTSGSANGGLTWEQTWPWVFTQIFGARYETIGLATHGRGYLPPTMPGTGITPDYVTVTGTPALIGGFGLNTFTYDISHSGGVKLVYSLTGDSFIISYCLHPSGGSFTWQINSGAVNTVSTANSVISDTGIVFENSGVSAGQAYTLTINYSSGSPVWIDGVIEFNGDLSAGLQIYNMGLSGGPTAYWNGQNYQMLGSLFPSLVILELGAADWVLGVPPATVQANLSAIMSQITAAVTAHPVSFLLMIPPAPQGVSNGYTWQQYVQAMYTLAAASPVTDLLDLTLRMPPSNGTGGPYSLYAANGELTSIGHALVADILCSYVGPQ